MNVKAVDLAKYVVQKCTTEKRPVSNLQLQKIMYFLQAVYCKWSNGDLLFEDSFEAWPYGPVLPEVYRLYSANGSGVICKSYGVKNPFCGNEGTMRFVDDGIMFLRRKSPWDLVRISHAPGSPWSRVWCNGAGYKCRIPNDYIVESAKKGLVR